MILHCCHSFSHGWKKTSGNLGRQHLRAEATEQTMQNRPPIALRVEAIQGHAQGQGHEAKVVSKVMYYDI